MQLAATDDNIEVGNEVKNEYCPSVGENGRHKRQGLGVLRYPNIWAANQYRRLVYMITSTYLYTIIWEFVCQNVNRRKQMHPKFGHMFEDRFVMLIQAGIFDE
jgi:hypothetical protein